MDEQGPQPADDQKAPGSVTANRLLYQGLACFVVVSGLVVLGIYLSAPWPVRVALLILASVLLIRGQVVVDTYRRAIDASRPRHD